MLAYYILVSSDAHLPATQEQWFCNSKCLKMYRWWSPAFFTLELQAGDVILSSNCTTKPFQDGAKHGPDIWFDFILSFCDAPLTTLWRHLSALSPGTCKPSELPEHPLLEHGNGVPVFCPIKVGHAIAPWLLIWHWRWRVLRDTTMRACQSLPPDQPELRGTCEEECLVQNRVIQMSGRND